MATVETVAATVLTVAVAATVLIVAVLVTVTAVDLAVFKASVLLGHLINKNQTIKFS